MYIKQVVLFSLLYLSSCCCDRVWLKESGCDRHGTGFLCLPKIGEKRTIIFECPVKNKDYQIYINEFNGPKSMEKLIVRNCKSLTVLFQCTKTALESKNLTFLQISNIANLKIGNKKSYQSLLPPTVVLENIESIKKIPSHTFTQTNKPLNHKRCVLPDYNFSTIYFRNVSINRVKENAFYLPNDFGNVTFTNVKIKTLDRSSITINQGRGGVFIVEHSTVEEVKNSAIQVAAEKTLFSNNIFSEISSGGIDVKTGMFNFVNNSVEGQLHSQGLAVTSQRVVVSSNRFKHLKTGAFSGIGGSDNKIGSYEYVGNVMDFLEDDSLFPELYTHMSNQVTFQRNTFFCECHKSSWFLSKIASNNNVTAADEFYRKIFDERSENVCYSTCNLSINAAQEKIVRAKCTDRITVNDICTAKKKTSAQRVTVTPNTNPIFPKFFTPHMSTFHQSNGTTVLSKINKIKLGSNAATSPTTNKIETFNATNKSINEKELTLALLTTPKITTSPTVSLIKTYIPTKNKLNISNSTNKAINRTELIKKTTQALPTPQKLTNSTVSVTKILPAIYTSTIHSYSNSTSSERPFTSSKNDVFILTTIKEKLGSKNISPTEHEVNFNTNYTTSPDTQTEESYASLETFLTSDLTTATSSVTTVPTTKYKSAVDNETISLFTTEYLSTSFHEVTANSKIEKNCSNVYSILSSILFLILSVLLIVL